MLIDCPHCFTRVVPKADGTCPACQKDTRETAGGDLTRATMPVAQGDVLPPVCCHCGRDTRRCVAVSIEAAGKGQDLPGGGTAISLLLSLASLFVSMLAFLILWPVFVYRLLRGIAGTSVVEVRVPQCEVCAAYGDPRPQRVDFENARMTLVVHKRLKEATAVARRAAT